MRKLVHAVYIVMFWPSSRIENDRVRRVMVGFVCVQALNVGHMFYVQAKQNAEARSQSVLPL